MAYKVCIYNEGTETVIHFPSSDKTNPHLSKMDLDEKVNDIDDFKFTISSENQGYNLLKEFTTKVKIIDINDNSIKFTGRVLSIDEQMDSTGLFYKEVSCENALAYLLDINSRNNAIMANDLTTALTMLLNRYNASCLIENKIQLGNITAVQNNISYGCNYESIYAVISNILKDNKNYYLQVRESNSSLFLDCLSSVNSNTPEVRLGVNMKSLIKSKDTSKLITRLIPLGANSINISSVNGGIDYIEDETAKGLYGVLEGTISYSDITDATTLYNTAKADLSNYTQPLLTLQIDALDLSKLTGIKANEFVKGMSLHIVNPVMAIDTVVKIVECDVDLTKEYNPKLTLSNILQTMQDIVSSLQNSSLMKDSCHHGIQLGDDFGLRAYGSTNTTQINGDTFEISRNSDNEKVLYTDESGNITVQDITANKGTYNDILTNNMVAKDMSTSSDSGNTIKMHDQYVEFYSGDKKILELGSLASNGDLPSIIFPTKTGDIMIFSRDSGGLNIFGNVDFQGTETINEEQIATRIWVDGKNYATKDWVTANFQAKATT